MHALGIDHYVDRKRVKAAAAKLDLLDPEHQTTVFQQLSQGLVACLFAAPPCGTSSMARCIKIQGSRPGPRPLRSPEFPYGFPWNTGLDVARVLSANRLYCFTCQAAALAHQAGALVIIENPENSLMYSCGCSMSFVRFSHWGLPFTVSTAVCMDPSGPRRQLSLQILILVHCAFVVIASTHTCLGKYVTLVGAYSL